MRVQGLLLLFLLPLAVFLLAQEEADAFPSVFDALPPECNCSVIIGEVDVSRAIAITEMKFHLQEEEGWFESTMGYLDVFHASLTQTVHVFSANTDRQLASWSGDENATRTPRATPREGNASEGMSAYFDRLFHDDTYLYSSEASYLILRLGLETNKEKGPSFLNELRFAISLPHTQKQLQIFIGDPLEDENKQIVNDAGRINETTAVGARYFVPEFIDNLRTDLSAGFRGINNPFVQGRVEYPINFYDWLIRPVQYVEYSVKRKFYEESDLYFDRRISQQEMVRLQLQRSTETKKVGMQYSAALSYFNTLRFSTGFRTFVGLSGETTINEGRYADPHYDDVDPKVGVYRYSVGGSWKASFLRPWLFYEIEPRVDYDMLYNWRPNYVVRYWFEIYFGDT